jgi:hypothetical protein
VPQEEDPALTAAAVIDFLAIMEWMIYGANGYIGH